MRAVVDTNVWISGLLNPSGPPAGVMTALADDRFILVTSKPMLDELRGVLLRPRFTRRYAVTPAKVANLLGVLETRGEMVQVYGWLRLCRVPNDDVVIETALNGRADVLVTRDDDLKGELQLVDYLAELGISVLTVGRFLALQERPSETLDPGQVSGESESAG